MANDYLNLAQLTKPQMMGNAPIGGGALAGWDYGNQVSRQQGFIDQASGQAALSAQMDEQKQREFMMGVPGREANIGTENALALGKQQMAPDMLEEQRLGLEGKVAGHKKRSREELKATMEDAANQWAALDPADDKGKVQIIFQLQESGVKSIRGVPLDQLSKEELDTHMKRIRKASVETPAHLQDMLKEQEKGRQRAQLEAQKATARTEMLKLGAQLKEKLLASTAGQKNPGDVKDRILDEMRKRAMAETNPELQQIKLNAVMEYAQQIDQEIARAKAQSAPQQFDVDPAKGTVSARPATPPAPVPMPNLNNITSGGSSSAPNVADSIKPGNMWNGQKVIQIGKDPKTGKVMKVKTADGKVHDYK